MVDKENVQAQTSSEPHMATPVATRKYGSWMLVTRKSIHQDKKNNKKHVPQKPVQNSYKGNSFEPLHHADADEGEATPQVSGKVHAETNRRDKGKSPSNVNPINNRSRMNPRASKPPRQQSKGKSAVTANQDTAVANTSDQCNQVPKAVANTSDQRNQVPKEMFSQKTVAVEDRNASVPAISNYRRSVQQVSDRGVRTPRGRGSKRGDGRDSRGPSLDLYPKDGWLENHGIGGSPPTSDTLILDCKFLMRHFQNFKMTHICREGNQCADLLANHGQSTTWGTTIFEVPPDGLTQLMDSDARTCTYRRIR
nr:LINE-type retrotransposon LIb DNA [Ipomoea batatas]